MSDRETMECVCGAAGTIREHEAGEGFAQISCSACGYSQRVTGLALVMWALRATSRDPEGDRWKSAAT
jgi:hypothetical protein